MSNQPDPNKEKVTYNEHVDIRDKMDDLAELLTRTTKTLTHRADIIRQATAEYVASQQHRAAEVFSERSIVEDSHDAVKAKVAFATPDQLRVFSSALHYRATTQVTYMEWKDTSADLEELARQEAGPYGKPNKSRIIQKAVLAYITKKFAEIDNNNNNKKENTDNGQRKRKPTPGLMAGKRIAGTRGKAKAKRG
jgi:hypothetical protein